jgi:hypothetical protein
MKLMKNNPFKMIGPYIGGVVGYFAFYEMLSYMFNNITFGSMSLISFDLGSQSTQFALPMIFIVIGFLVGWFIEVKFVNKKRR